MRAVEAVFQLLISAIILVVVSITVYNVFNTAVQEDCTRKWTTQLKSMSSTIKTVYFSAPPTRMSTSFDFRCGEIKKVEISLLPKEKGTCVRVCGKTGQKGCIVMEMKAFSPKEPEPQFVLYECVLDSSKYLPTDTCNTGVQLKVNDPVTLTRLYGRIFVSRQFGSDGVSICIEEG